MRVHSCFIISCVGSAALSLYNSDASLPSETWKEANISAVRYKYIDFSAMKEGSDRSEQANFALASPSGRCDTMRLLRLRF